MLRWACLVLALCAAPLRAEPDSALAHLERGKISDRWLGFGATDVTLTLSQGVPWRVFTLIDPLRLVLDFREVDWTGADPQALDRSKRVVALRMGPLRPGWSRMVMELDRPMAVTEAALSVARDTGAATLSLRLEASDADSFAAQAGAPHEPGWDLPVVQHTAPAPRSGRPVVVLDPGHGGIDPGAQHNGVSEADLMLAFARELADVLRRTGEYEVVLTRDSNRFVSLEGRVALAQAAGADLFVSLHADAIREGVAHGATVYTLSDKASDKASAALAARHDRADILAGVDLSGADDTVAQVLMEVARQDNTPRSRALARHLVKGITGAGATVHKRPLRQSGFSVLKAADVPSVLVELGFLSTDEDLAHLTDPVWRANMARGLTAGIAAWALEDEALRALRHR